MTGHLPKRILRQVFLAWTLCALPLGSWGNTPPPPAHPISTPSATAATDDIRDIRGPAHIPYPWLWILYAAGGLAGLALLFFAYRTWKRRAKPTVKLPHEIALDQLQQALALMKPEQAREFSIAVSGAVRTYIEARFGAKAAHRTTEEFLHDLLTGSSTPLSQYSAPLKDFLTHCDLAKFAKWSLSVREMESMHESARKFVLETKLQEETKKANPPNRKESAAKAPVGTVAPSVPQGVAPPGIKEA